MSKLLLALVLISVVATSAYAATTYEPKQVTMQGQMICMMCDCVESCMPKVEKAPHSCMAVFKTEKGRIYTLAPTKSAMDLLNVKMHEQYVEITGRVMPGSMILVVESYKVIKEVKPETPEKSDDWQIGYF